MKPEFKIKKTILLQAIETEYLKIKSDDLTSAEQIDLQYDLFDGKCDFEDEFREGTEETEITPIWSRHYETKSVAAKMFDGSWVGWTYWYGGGKHGEPGAIDWMDSAYDLNCKEEEKLMIVRTFEKTA